MTEEQILDRMAWNLVAVEGEKNWFYQFWNAYNYLHIQKAVIV